MRSHEHTYTKSSYYRHPCKDLDVVPTPFKEKTPSLQISKEINKNLMDKKKRSFLQPGPSESRCFETLYPDL